MADHDFAAVGEFAIPFAYGLSALRKAADANESVTLTGEQAKAVIDAFRMLNPGPEDREHYIDFDETGWAIQHPLACRPNLLDCGLHHAITLAAAGWDEPPRPPGRYIVTNDVSGLSFRSTEGE